MGLSYKFVLDKRRKQSDNIYPLKLRIYESTGNKEMSLDIHLDASDWDIELEAIKPSDPNYKTNIYKFNSIKSKIDRKLLLAVDDEFALTADALLESLKKQKPQTANVTFKQYADLQIAGLLEAGKAGTALAYADATNSILNYAKNDKLRFEDINYKLLQSYNNEMLAKGIKVNSIAAYLRSIRAIYNKAIKSELVNREKYPFDAFKIETEDTPSRKLLIEELEALIEYPLEEGTTIWHNRNYFLLSFCLIGINFADMFTLELNDIMGGNISYKRNKTGRLYNFALHPYAAKIMQYYRSLPSRNGAKYVLPNLEYGLDSLSEKKRIKQLCKYCSKYMKKLANACGINKSISTYYARYSWANIAKKLGYSNDMIAEALGHEYGNNVTNIYLDNYSNEAISAMNDHVLQTVFKYKKEG